MKMNNVKLYGRNFLLEILEDAKDQDLVGTSFSNLLIYEYQVIN